MDEHLAQIVRLAWTRRLGVPDDAAVPGARLDVPRDDTDRLDVLTVCGATVVVGPERAVAAVASLDPLDVEALRATTGGTRSRIEILGYCTDWLDSARLDDPLVADDADAVANVERECPPDDVTEAELPGDVTDDARVVLVDEPDTPLGDSGDGDGDDPRFASAATFGEVSTLLADVRVLTVPSARGRGAGSTVATIATHAALDAGLVPQWRVRPDNTAARALGRALGYADHGVYVTLRVRTD